MKTWLGLWLHVGCSSTGLLSPPPLLSPSPLPSPLPSPPLSPLSYSTLSYPPLPLSGRARAPAHARTHARTHAHTHTHTHTHIHTHTASHTHTNTRARAHSTTHTHTHTASRARAHTHTQVWNNVPLAHYVNSCGIGLSSIVYTNSFTPGWPIQVVY